MGRCAPGSSGRPARRLRPDLDRAGRAPPGRRRSGRRRRRAAPAAAGPRSTRSPGLARHMTPAAGAHRVLLAGPAGAEPPGGHPTARASSRCSQPVSGAAPACGVRGAAAAARPDRRPAPRSSPGSVSSARPSASAAAGSASTPGQREHLGRPAPASPRPGPAGPRRAASRRTPRTSTALPTARPSGASMPVSSAEVRTPCSLAERAPWSAPAAGRRRDPRMNAPLPTFTSSTSAAVPSAIFLDMIELAISGIDSTVPVTSRSAYSLRSAGARPGPAAQMTQPIRAQHRRSSRPAAGRPASRGSTPACPACRRCGRARGRTAAARRRRSWPRAARGSARPCRPRRRWSACPRSAHGTEPRSSRSPESIMAAVQVRSSAGSRPRK